VGVKVLSSSGSGWVTAVVRGIEWAVNDCKKTRKKSACVLSLSLGGLTSKAMDASVVDAGKEGMVVVVAAGNANEDACFTSPARMGGGGRRGVLSVASSNARDTRSSFSNFGSCVDIFAPGSGITSCWKGESDSRRTLSGTSMSTPHVAGVAAMLLEKHAGDAPVALRELIDSAATGLLRGVGVESPNLLLQAPVLYAPKTPADGTFERFFLPNRLPPGFKCRLRDSKMLLKFSSVEGSADECAAACLDDDRCRFIHFNERRDGENTCTTLETCSRHGISPAREVHSFARGGT
jgi:subtilisin family serine protease